MDPRSLQFVASACGAEQAAGAPETVIRRVCTDSRQAAEGDLFVALRGDRFDGHDYLVDVAQRQVAAVMVERRRRPRSGGLPGGLGILVVENTRAALGALATQYRQELRLAVIAVAGSNGKTTTKELLAAVLRQRLATLWSPASFNNDIGVPLTLLELTSAHRAAVLEVGTNHPGELAPLVSMVQPQYGVLTNIGREHLEFFGDLAGVAEEEAALAKALPAFGTLFVNGDDPWTPWLVQRTSAKVVTVGLGADNDWRAHDVRVGEDGVRFAVAGAPSGYSGDYALRLLGRHQVSNALLALAVGTELGVPPEDLRRGLAECAPARHRLQVQDVGGIRVVNDAYNANADSMLAALQTLRDLPCAGRRVAVLGDMAELGLATGDAHREIGRRAAELGIDRLVAVGAWAHATAAAARAAGLQDVRTFDAVDAAGVAVGSLAEPGDIVLIKASRVAGLERVADQLGRRDGARPAA